MDETIVYSPAHALPQGGISLLPCPFCGKEEVRTRRQTIGQDWEWIVECVACGAWMSAVSEHRAIADWNHRAQHQETEK